jgi:hypothetical protein
MKKKMKRKRVDQGYQTHKRQKIIRRSQDEIEGLKYMYMGLNETNKQRYELLGSTNFTKNVFNFNFTDPKEVCYANKLIKCYLWHVISASLTQNGTVTKKSLKKTMRNIKELRINSEEERV